MCGRGDRVANASSHRAGLAAMLVALLLAWPTLGAGDRGGGERVAHGIAWHVKASATLVVGPAR